MNKDIEQAFKSIDTFPVEHKRPIHYELAMAKIKKYINAQEKTIDGIKKALDEFSNGTITGYSCISKITEIIDCFK